MAFITHGNQRGHHQPPNGAGLQRSLVAQAWSARFALAGATSTRAWNTAEQERAREPAHRIWTWAMVLTYSTRGSGSFSPDRFPERRTVVASTSSGRKLGSFRADITWTKGRHTIKFGHTTYWMQSQIFNAGFITGRFVFDGRFSEDPVTAVQAAIRWPISCSASHVKFATRTTGTWPYGAPWLHQYVQDDWRVSDKLTINLGLALRGQSALGRQVRQDLEPRRRH